MGFGISDLAKLLSGLLTSAFPTIASATMPTAGTGVGDIKLLPSNNVALISDAIGATAAAAVGGANPAAKMHMFQIELATATLMGNNPEPHALMAISAARKYRLKQQYSGVAWAYGGAVGQGIYLVRGAPKNDTEVTRPIMAFDPADQPHEVEHCLLSFYADSSVRCLAYAGGKWRSMAIWQPPQDDGATPHSLMSWEASGPLDAQRNMGVWGEGARPAFAYQVDSPSYGSGLFILVEQGWLYLLRNSQPGGYDPNSDGSFVTMDGNYWPFAMDIEHDDPEPGGGLIDHPWEYMVAADPNTAEVRWFNVRRWDGTFGGNGSRISLLKRVVAFDAAQAGGIVDLCIDRVNNVMWVLANDGWELQKYELDVFVPDADPPLDLPDNPPAGLLPSAWPETAAIGERNEITLQLLDMWGRSTIGSGTSVKVAAIALQGNLDTGSLLARQASAEGDDHGKVTVYYTFGGDATADETIMARVI